MKKNQAAIRNGNFIPFREILKTMKIFTLLILVSTTQMFANGVYSKNARISINLSGTTVASVFDAIKAKSDFDFFYNDKLIDVERTVSINVEEKDIYVILDQLFDKTDVGYLVKENQIFLSNQLKEDNLLQNQAKKVNGNISDVFKNPLPGVTIYEKGTTNGTISDANGNYSISNLSESSILVFSFIGMKTVEIIVGSQTNINVSLQEESYGLEEIVTIGYGTRSKRDITTAISTLGSEQITKAVPSTPELLMQGQMSGVQIIGNQGNPNARPTVSGVQIPLELPTHCM